MDCVTKVCSNENRIYNECQTVIVTDVNNPNLGNPFMDMFVKSLVLRLQKGGKCMTEVRFMRGSYCCTRVGVGQGHSPELVSVFLEPDEVPHDVYCVDMNNMVRIQYPVREFVFLFIIFGIALTLMTGMTANSLDVDL